ncbi:hypothetical protein P692DRAFT_20822074 [Suillus brevipes Sb2]|nr:hypothetical protein P692DRAFT_20822074 [Suillus brevipes Sb2]
MVASLTDPPETGRSVLWRLVVDILDSAFTNAFLLLLLHHECVGDVPGDGRGKSWPSSSSTSASSGIRGVDVTVKSVSTKSLDRRRLSRPTATSPKDAAATLPSTVTVRGPSSALSERYLRVDLGEVFRPSISQRQNASLRAAWSQGNGDEI